MTSKDKNLDIQALRAIAIIMVILQHYRNRLPSPEWYLTTFNYINYWAGVDIFLAISGYLMCKSLSHQILKKGRSANTFLTFMYRRLFRLVPCLLTWCFFCIILAHFMQPSWGVSPYKSLTTLYTSLLGYSNIHFYYCAISSSDCDQMNAVTWSLSLEWQLYVLIALVMLFFTRKFYLFAFISIILISLLLPVTHMYNQSIGWWIRPHAFFLGAIIYLAGSYIEIKKNYVRLTIIITSIIILLVAPEHFNYRIALPIIGISSALCFLCFLNGGIKGNKKSLTYRILDWIGDRSYSIYLCHLPLMHLTRESLNALLVNTAAYQNKILYLSVFFILLSILSNISYKLIELRFIAIGQSISGKYKILE